jgi:hypothetical protein
MTKHYQTLVIAYEGDRMQPPVKGFNMSVAGCEVLAMNLGHSIQEAVKLEQQNIGLKEALFAAVAHGGRNLVEELNVMVKDAGEIGCSGEYTAVQEIIDAFNTHNK